MYNDSAKKKIRNLMLEANIEELIVKVRKNFYY